jgi:hypothetical protein
VGGTPADSVHLPAMSSAGPLSVLRLTTRARRGAGPEGVAMAAGRHRRLAQKYNPNPTVGPFAFSFMVRSRFATVSAIFR